MENTNNFAFDFIDYYHVNKHTITNRNFLILDHLLHNNILVSRTSSTYDQNNIAVGDMYCIPNKAATSASNETTNDVHTLWVGRCGEIGCYIGNNEWHFIKLRAGMLFFIKDEGVLSIFCDNTWKDLQSIPEMSQKTRKLDHI